MFKSLIHFELLFVYKETIVFFLDVSIQFFQHHLLMKLSFPYLCVCGNFIQINDHTYEGSFVGSLFYPLVRMILLMKVPYLLL